ncbi:GNAT family N-acetyltransferase [Thioclava sp. FR2]|uniref:GNAT family N-acetyltransferase n=1 Tax=Thioclava sp. FR2 TaxID=3445780 RepID=UPI003EBC8201
MIRPAAPADAAAIGAIWNAVIRDTVATFNSAEKTIAEIEALIAARHASGRCFLVAEDDHGLCGFVTYDQFRGGVGYVATMEHTIHIAPRAVGKGWGRALMAAMEQHARERGVHVMVAGVTGENESGQSFHKSLGYSSVAIMPEVGQKFGRRMDLWLMQKFLT